MTWKDYFAGGMTVARAKVEILSESQLMERLHISSPATLFKWRRLGMPAMKGPGLKAKVFYDWDRVQEWLESNAAVKTGAKVPAELPDFMRKGGGGGD